MGIAVNGVDIDDRAIERELAHHQQADNPLKQAVQELVLRTVLLQQADTLGILGDDDERIDTLLALQVKVPKADDEACLRYYRNHAAAYTSGDMVEARHVLLQVTPNASLELLRGTGSIPTAVRGRSAAAWVSSRADSACRNSRSWCSGWARANWPLACWKRASVCTSSRYCARWPARCCRSRRCAAR